MAGLQGAVCHRQPVGGQGQHAGLRGRLIWVLQKIHYPLVDDLHVGIAAVQVFFSFSDESALFYFSTSQQWEHGVPEFYSQIMVPGSKKSTFAETLGKKVAAFQ